MSRLGVISNPVSDGNRGHPAIAGFAASHSELIFAAPPAVAALPDVLADFSRRGVDVLGVDGGDGTLRDVLTALPRGYGANWPAIAMLPSGKTNLAARDIGSFGGGVTGLRRLMDALNDPAKCVAFERHCLEAVREDNPSNVIARGMFFGAGVFTYATRKAGGWTFDRGIKQNLGVALTMAQVLRRSFLAPHELPAADMAVFEAAADEPEARQHFVVLATTLNKLMLGFWPFPDRGEGALHWIAVAAPPRRLARLMWRAWKGRMKADAASGVNGGATGALIVRLGEPFVVDGELYDPGLCGVLLRPGPIVRFLSIRE
jgi:hypothetical protein